MVWALYTQSMYMTPQLISHANLITKLEWEAPNVVLSQMHIQTCSSTEEQYDNNDCTCSVNAAP